MGCKSFATIPQKNMQNTSKHKGKSIMNVDKYLGKPWICMDFYIYLSLSTVKGFLNWVRIHPNAALNMLENHQPDQW